MENEKYGSLDNQGSQAKAKQTRPYWQQRKLRKIRQPWPENQGSQRY